MINTINGNGSGRPWPIPKRNARVHREEGGAPAANRPAVPPPLKTRDPLGVHAEKSKADESKYAPKEWGENWTYFAAPFGYDKVRMERALKVLAKVREVLPALSIHSSLEYEGVLGEESGKHGDIQHVLDFFGVPKPARAKAHTCALHLCHRMAESCANLIYLTDSDHYPQKTSYGCAAEIAIACNLGKDVFEIGGEDGEWKLKIQFSKRADWYSPFPLNEFKGSRTQTS